MKGSDSASGGQGVRYRMPVSKTLAISGSIVPGVHSEHTKVWARATEVDLGLRSGLRWEANGSCSSAPSPPATRHLCPKG
jgi:hypothetical protein